MDALRQLRLIEDPSNVHFVRADNAVGSETQQQSTLHARDQKWQKSKFAFHFDLF
jgi:hypothetical protein